MEFFPLYVFIESAENTVLAMMILAFIIYIIGYMLNERYKENKKSKTPHPDDKKG